MMTAALLEEEVAWGEPAAGFAFGGPGAFGFAVLELGTTEQARRRSSRSPRRRSLVLRRGGVGRDEGEQGARRLLDDGDEERRRLDARRREGVRRQRRPRRSLRRLRAGRRRRRLARPRRVPRRQERQGPEGPRARDDARPRRRQLRRHRARRASSCRTRARLLGGDGLQRRAACASSRATRSSSPRAASVSRARPSRSRASTSTAARRSASRSGTSRPSRSRSPTARWTSTRARPRLARRRRVGRVRRGRRNERDEKECLLRSAHAIAFVHEAAMRCGDDGVQLHGGAGFMRDYPVEKLMRDAKQIGLCGMTAEHADQLAGAVALGAPHRPRARAADARDPERVRLSRAKQREEHQMTIEFSLTQEAARDARGDPRPREERHPPAGARVGSRRRHPRGVPPQHGAPRDEHGLERDALRRRRRDRRGEEGGRDEDAARAARTSSACSRPRSSRGATAACSSASPARASAVRRCAARARPSRRSASSASSRISTTGRSSGAPTASPSRTPAATSSGIRTSCRKDGQHWVLNGRKCYITNGARASWTVIFATIDPALGRAGHRAFVVEKGTPGFSVGRIEEKMGLRASETAELVLEDCRVPEENLLGGEEKYVSKEGFMTAMKTFDNTRPLVAAMALRHRPRGVRVRVRLREGQLHPLAPDPALRGDRRAPRARSGARSRPRASLTWRAAWMADNGIANAKEASMSKAMAGQAAIKRVHRGHRDLRRARAPSRGTTSSSRSGSATSRSTTSSRAPGRSSAS